MLWHKMDKKKEDLKLLLVYAVIGIIAAGTTGWFLYQNRMKFWKEQACAAFRVALMEELQKRKEVETYYAFSGNMSLPIDSIDSKMEPITVSMESEYGKKDFVIPYEKHIHNIERSSSLRALYSYVLERFPLKADSLNAVWGNLLSEMGFYGKTIVRVVVTDWWERENCAYSDDSLLVAKSDSLTSKYLGYRCEVGTTGYMYYPWWTTLTIKDKILLCALVFCCCLLFFIQEYIVKAYRYCFVREVTVVVEKEIPVVMVEKNQAHIYQLEDDLRFDTGVAMLIRRDARVQLTAMPAKLLQVFLEAENRRLSVNEIMELLWSGNAVDSARVYTIIKRLRKELAKISDWEITNENGSYQLKNPHSIEE